MTDDLMARVRAAAEIAVDEVADKVLGESINLAPIETGRLRESAKVTNHRDDVRGYTDQVSFNTPYAARQHEELSYQHPNGGQSKYLESALKSNIPGLEDHIARRVKEAVDG